MSNPVASEDRFSNLSGTPPSACLNQPLFLFLDTLLYSFSLWQGRILSNFHSSIVFCGCLLLGSLRHSNIGHVRATKHLAVSASVQTVKAMQLAITVLRVSNLSSLVYLYHKYVCKYYQAVRFVVSVIPSSRRR